MSKTMYATIDTETFGGASKPEGIYDLAVVIHDRYGNIVFDINYLIGEHYNKISESYYKKNLHIYEELIKENKVVIIDTEDEAIHALDDLLTLFNVKYVMAYNTNFDLVKTKCSKLIENREFIDIYQMAMDIIYNRPTYRKYCDDNNFYTKQHKPSCKVETVYGYIINDEWFEEQHTALSDATQESEIFAYLISCHKPYTKNTHYIKW